MDIRVLKYFLEVILNPKLETGLFLVWRDDQRRTRATQKFLDEFQASLNNPTMQLNP